MNEQGKSVILIGMPGAGKSTVGVLLAKELGMDFLDTDVAVQVREGSTMQDILDTSGYLDLRRIEEEVLLAIDDSPKVISTGGSAVYSSPAMNRLKSLGEIIYLRAPIDILRQRIDNYSTRGIARQPGQSFQDLFEERAALYEKHAGTTIDCGDSPPATIVSRLVSARL